MQEITEHDEALTCTASRMTDHSMALGQVRGARILHLLPPGSTCGSAVRMCPVNYRYDDGAQVRGAMMFVDQHEDWEAQGGELSHVMGQICALVLDRCDQPAFLDSRHQRDSSDAIEPAAGLLAAAEAADAAPDVLAPLTQLEVAAPGLAAAVA